MADRRPREFGVSPVNLAPESDAFGRLADAEQPLPELINLENQEANEERARAAEIALAEAKAQDAALARWDKDFPFGAVVRPEQENLRGYKFILRQAGGIRDVQFSPLDYGIFDSLIVQRCGVDESGKSLNPAFNPDHPDYKNYAPLRRNLAILRNYLLVTMFPDAVFLPKVPSDKPAKGKKTKTPKVKRITVKPDTKLKDTGEYSDYIEDAENYASIQEMANALGDALAGGAKKPGFILRWFHSVKRLFSGKTNGYA